MVTYQTLYTFIIANLVILCVLFLTGKVSKKAWQIIEFLIALCWAGFSWYYELRLSNHLPSGLHRNHFFLSTFLTVVYGFGCWLSIMLVFFFAVVLVTQLLSPDSAYRKKGIAESSCNHSPMPLWIAGIAVGLLSALLLNASLIPVLNRLMESITKLIYVKLFHMSKGFPSYYIPAAGIAAGTIIVDGAF